MSLTAIALPELFLLVTGGYGPFSVSPPHADKVRHYIATQEEHHRRVGFQDEFRSFLERYQVPYDERCVWD